MSREKGFPSDNLMESSGIHQITFEKEPFFMPNFSYAVKVLKAEFCDFMERLVEGSPRPIAKLFYDLVYGMLRSGSAKLSDIGRQSGEAKLDTVEHRLSKAIAKADPEPITAKLSALSLSMCPDYICCDESDTQKPYGKSFQWLDSVQDGSADGRPIGKGYHVICLVGIAARNSPMPLCLWAYSTKADGYKSQSAEHASLFPKDGAKRVISMDGGYDSSAFMRLAEERGLRFVIRAKSMRKYEATSGKWAKSADCLTIASALKGRHAFRFKEPDKADPVDVKASAIKVSHSGIPDGRWLAAEFFLGESEPRCYITDIDCSSREGCERALKAYRLRWRIEECFRFMKCAFDMEGMMVRDLNAMNWVLLAICAATAFLSSIASSRSAAYWQCKAAFKSFDPELTDEMIIEAKGHISVELYRLAGGAKEILGHSLSKPTPRGRDRAKRFPIQLLLDDAIFK